MVAVAAQPLKSIVPPSVIAGRGDLVPFTVDEVLAILRMGLWPEDSSIELLNGLIVHKDTSKQGGDPTVHDPGHHKSVRKLTRLSKLIDCPDRCTQIQLSIVCGKRQMPEPDFAVLRGDDDVYTDRLPTAADTHCVVEVADSSLERDRDEKGPIYAAAGIRQYVILNLRNRTAELYADPADGAYPPPVVVDQGGTISLRVGEDEFIDVQLLELLP